MPKLSLFALLSITTLAALLPAPVQACGRLDCETENDRYFPAQEHYDRAKKEFYAQLQVLLKSDDEYDRRRAQMLLKEMPGVISSSESLAAKKCDTVSRLIGNGKQSNIADFRCQADEMKKTEAYLGKVLSTLKDLEYPEGQGYPAGRSSEQEENQDRSAE